MAAQEQFVVTHPDGGVGTFEYPAHHSRQAVGIKTSDCIESRIAANPRPLTNLSIHRDSGRIVVDGSGGTATLIALSESMAPHTAEAHDGDSHVLSAS
jgi:hypothetical protein